MEKKKTFPAVVLMPTNRVKEFLSMLPAGYQPKPALTYGIRCREEAFALDDFAVEENLENFLAGFPSTSAFRYFLPLNNLQGSAKVCYFSMQFASEPMFYTVWVQCSKVVATLSKSELKKLQFAIFENAAEKQVCFLSYSSEPDDEWVRMMLNFVHNIQPDEQEWVASEIKFETCEIKTNINF